MTEPTTLNDQDLDSVLNGDKPVLLLITTGDGIRGDFNTAFKKAADETKNMVFAKIDPTQNPRAAALFDIGSKPVLIAWYCGEEITRRSRPWGTDVPLAIELLQNLTKTQPPAAKEGVVEQPEEKVETVMESANTQPISNGKPVIVTDETFQKEVIDFSTTMPVLIDFWAEWCGPCRMVAPVLEKLAKEFDGQVRIAKVDTDANPGLSATFRIMSIPNIMAIKNRTIVFNQPGALPEAAFRDIIKQLIALEVPPPETEQADEEEDQATEVEEVN
jgi:thioredoxin 1